MLEVVLITTIPRLAPAPFFSCGRLPELGLSLRTHFIHSFRGLEMLHCGLPRVSRIERESHVVPRPPWASRSPLRTAAAFRPPAPPASTSSKSSSCTRAPGSTTLRTSLAGDWEARQ